MRTRNPSYDRAASVARGHVGRRAGTAGPTLYDAAGNEVTSSDVTFVGASVSGDGDMAYVSVSGTGDAATNNSGGDLVYGDVVVLDSDGTVTTTTTAQDTRPVGVVQIGGGDGDAIQVVFSGFVEQVNCTASVTAGAYGETSTTAGDATENATLRTGSFCQFLASSATPAAYLFGSPKTTTVSAGSWKDPVRTCAVTNGTLSTAFANGQTVNGITLATGDRIVLMAQSSGAENGIYTVNASGAPTRAADMDSAEEVLGACVFVLTGDVGEGDVVRCTNETLPTLGTTALTFEFAYPRGGISVSITADQNDWNPTSLQIAYGIKMAPTADRKITGITAPAAGLVGWHRLYNWSAYNVTLVHNSGSSSAGNKFSNPDSQDYVIRPGGEVEVFYDYGNTVWRLLASSSVSEGRGSSFPASPTTNELFYRTDLNQRYYYSSVPAWLGTIEHHISNSFQNISASAAYAAINGSLVNAWLPVPGLGSHSDLWMQKLSCNFFVAGGGSALSGSHSWVGVLQKRQSNNTATTIATVTINSGASAVWRVDTETINALLNNGTTHYVLSMSWTKTGTPGDLWALIDITYRDVAT